MYNSSTMEAEITSQLKSHFSVNQLLVENESHMHRSFQGAGGKSANSHFKVVLVSNDFEGGPLIKRHRRVYQVLEEQMQAGIHALALHTLTPSEWHAQASDASPLNSPHCRGGG